MEVLDVDDVFHHYRLNPTEVEAVTYYLPRLISEQTLHCADKLIHSVEISGCEPKDLATRYAPVSQAISSGDWFFFTTCKSKNGSKLQSVRAAGGGTWSIQKTTEISHAGVKVGEVKNLSFKKGGKSTGWVMEEYRCLLPEATVADGVKVFCKMHLAQHAPEAAVKVGEVKNLSFKKGGKSTGWVMEEYRCLLPEATVADGVKVFCKMHLAQHAPEAARQESAAYNRQQAQPEAVTPSTHAQKRPATAAAADPHPPRPKERMCVAVPVPAPTTPSFLMYDEGARAMHGPLARTNFPVQDAQVPAVAAPASCESTTASNHFDAQAPEISSQSDVLESTQQQIVPEAGSSIARSTSEEEPLEPISNLPDGEEDGFDIEELMRMLEADPIEVEPVTGANTGVEMGQQEPLCLDGLDLQSDYPYPMWRSEDRAMHNPAFHDADKDKTYNAAPDLDAPSLQGQDHLFNPWPCSFDPFEEAWKAEEALEKEKRYNATANLHTGGHSNFFSPASVY